MAAILGAFVKYIVSFVFLTIVAALGVKCGIKLHDKDAEKKKQKES